MPRLERLWLPPKCTVPGRDALAVVGMLCRQLRRVHLHTVWDIGTLAAMRPVTFPNLETVVVDNCGNHMPGEWYVSPRR
jgi:hypothetical protein